MSTIESISKKYVSYDQVISLLEQLKKEKLEEIIIHCSRHLKLKINCKSLQNIWRVLTNYKWWNFPKYLKLVKEQPELLLLPQSLGKNKLPIHDQIKIGDIVFFHHIFLVEKKSVHRIVMRGIVESTIQEGNDHQIHPCNKGKTRPHADINNKFIRIYIYEIFDNPQIIEYNNIRSTWLKR